MNVKAFSHAVMLDNMLLRAALSGALVIFLLASSREQLSKCAIVLPITLSSQKGHLGLVFIGTSFSKDRVYQLENHLFQSIVINMSDVKDIIGLMKNPSPKDAALVTKAFAAAQKAHEGQKRLTGEPYIEHVFETAKTLAQLRMCPESIAAGLLHDTLEDGLLSAEDLKKEFGEGIFFLINGVTKLGKLKYRGLERHTESLRKLFVATAQDARVLIIRLADRLHNVRTLGGHTSPEKRARIAIETLEIFVPLANRLGMGQLRGEMEDYAFPYAYPEEYKKVKELLKQRSGLNQEYLEKIHRSLQKKLAEQGITGVKIDYRIKRMYSLFKKLQRNDMDIEKIHDVVALRVVVPTIGDCYSVLGIVHNTWRPLPGRIKDYIATPKLSGYQSLHTTIFTGDGGIAEIQIRTKEMHDEAEYGIASHLSYKETENGTEHLQKRFEKQLPWIKQLLEWQKSTTRSGEFLEHLRTEFFKDRVFVFTPDGDVIDLPEESSPVDFAYAIHTDIGNHLSGVKINGKMVSLDTPLKTGDIIEIVTKKGAHPTTKWLKYAKTALAKKQIRSETANEGLSLKNFFPNLRKK